MSVCCVIPHPNVCMVYKDYKTDFLLSYKKVYMFRMVFSPGRPKPAG